MLGKLPKMRNLFRERFLRPRRIVHEVVVVKAHSLAVNDGARSEVDANAVKRSLVECVGVAQEHFGAVAVEFPGECDELSPLGALGARECICKKRKRCDDGKQNSCGRFHTELHFT